MSAPETELCAKPREWPNSCAATAKRLVPERKQREAFQSSDLALSLRLFLLSSTIFLVVLSPVSSSKFLSFSFFFFFAKQTKFKQLAREKRAFFPILRGDRWQNVNQRTKRTTRRFLGKLPRYELSSRLVAIHTYILRNVDVNSSLAAIYRQSSALNQKPALEDEHENKWNGLRSSSEGTRDPRVPIFSPIFFSQFNKYSHSFFFLIRAE